MPGAKAKISRNERLAQKLRENLKRRKSQARTRSERANKPDEHRDTKPGD